MYKVFCDEYLIHDDSLEMLQIFKTKLSLELNKVGSFKFTIYSNHPYFDKLQKLKSIIKVYQNGYLLFKGRIINDVNGFYNEKQVTCESDLAFLLDTIQRPYTFSGSPEELLAMFIGYHNLQSDDEHKFILGNVTVTDPNDYITRSDSTYLNTWDSIKKKLIDGLGGYLIIRHEEDGSYIDYLEDVNLMSSQKIEFAKNLMDMKRTVKADDICTVLIPLGSKNGETRLTVSSVNGGKDYIEHEEGIQKYGRIVKVQTWDDVTVASNLLRKGTEYLNSTVQLTNNIVVTAADLSTVNKDINSFHLGTKVRVTTKPHSIDQTFLISKISIDLLDPAKNKISFDTSFTSMTEQQTTIKDSFSKVEQATIDMNTKIDVTKQELQSSIEASSQSITTTVSENVYLKNETDELIDNLKTSLEQTSTSFEMKFDMFHQSLDDVVNGTDAEFEEIKKYIRFTDGKIILGEAGNNLELKIANDRISFMQNNSEVAYFSNNKLFVTDGEYTNSLQLGKFAFLPRTNGNLSFKKVRE